MEDSLSSNNQPPAKKDRAVTPNLKLRHERELRGWSQALVAQKIGAQTGLVNRWETGRAFPSPYYREKLCGVFSLDADSLGLIKSDIIDSSLDQLHADEDADIVSLDPPSSNPSLSVINLHLTVPYPNWRFNRRSFLFGLLSTGALAAVATGGLMLAHNVTQPTHAADSPSISTVYIYRPSPQAFVNFVAWSPLGDKIVTAIGDSTARILDSSLGSTLFVYRKHKGFINCVNWSSDAAHVVSASADKTVQIWTPLTGEQVLTYKGHTSSVYCAVYSHDGSRIASSGRDKTVQVWDTFTGQLLTTYKGHTQGVWNIVWSLDDNTIYSSGEDGGIHVWNSVTTVNSTTFTYQGPSGIVNEIALSPDGRQLISSHIDGTVHIWDSLTGYGILTYKGHAASVGTARWSPNGKLVASAGYDKTVQVWQPSNGQHLLTCRAHTDEIIELAWSPDSTEIASGGKDSTLCVCKVHL